MVPTTNEKIVFPYIIIIIIKGQPSFNEIGLGAPSRLKVSLTGLTGPDRTVSP